MERVRRGTYLYSAAETVRVRTVLEFELHQPTCMGWAVTVSMLHKAYTTGRGERK
jgi:hypothetical protein